MGTHLAIFFADRGDVAVSKSHVIKSPNQMGWLYWRFAAMTVENRGNERAHLESAGEFNRRYLTCQISAILYLKSIRFFMVGMKTSKEGI